MRGRATVPSLAVVLVATACATSQFQRHLARAQWSEAARDFDADSALRNDEHALYRGALLFGSPGRSTYDPEKGQALLRTFVARFPASRDRAAAAERLALLDDVVRGRHAAARERELALRIDTLDAQARVLSARLDSASSRDDQARRVIARLESDLHDREEQIRALRLELQRLKAIDLKPRRPPES